MTLNENNIVADLMGQIFAPKLEEFLILITYLFLFSSFSYFVLECQGPDIPRTYLIDIKDTTNHTIKMTLNENNVVADLMGQMSAPKSEEFLIPVPNSDRKLRAKFYYPPELRKDEFIKFPLILHV